jgi:23S rRNA pseudouridine2605 synthase
MRLNRFLARAGVASRRGADRIVVSGRVRINGRTVREHGVTVDPDSDCVEVDGHRVRLPEQATYIIVNKPIGYVVTMNDPQGRKTVAEFVPRSLAGVIPVGRLDVDTDGLLIMTNDGELAHRVSHPSFELDKVYEVLVGGVLSEKSVRRLERGISLDGTVTAPATIDSVSTSHNRSTCRITIHEGRKRQIRRMFEAAGHSVRSLRRVRIGPIELGDLKPGHSRSLTERELQVLREAVELDTE